MNSAPPPFSLSVAALALAFSALPLVGCQNQQKVQAAQHLDNAVALYEQGFEDEALTTLRLALENDPTLVDAHLGEAKIYRGRGDAEAALTAYQRAAALDPENFEATYGGALMHHLAGRVLDAIDGYLVAIRLDPESFDAMRDLGAAYLQLGRAPEALPAATRATELDPNSQPAWSNLAVAQGMLGRWDDAVGSYRRAAELGSLEDPMLLGLANAHIQLKSYERAINVLESLLRRNPSARAHERLGFSHFKLYRLDAALEAFEAALALAPQDVASLNGKAITHLTLHHERPSPNPFHRVTGVAALRSSLALTPQQPRIVDLLLRYGG